MEKQSNINDLLWTLLWAGCVPVAFWGRSVKTKLTEIALKRPQNGPKTTETSCNISLIQNQPLLKMIYKTPIITFKREKSFEHMLVRANFRRLLNRTQSLNYMYALASMCTCGPVNNLFNQC